MQFPPAKYLFEHRFPTAPAVWAVVVSSLLGSVAAQEESAIERASSVFSTWAETSEKIAKEKAKWELSKELLTARIAMLERQIQATKDLTAAERKKIAAFQGKTEKLTAERDGLRSSMEALAKKVGPLEERVVHLLDRVPEVVVGQVSTFASQIPRPAESAGASKPTGQQPQTQQPKDQRPGGQDVAAGGDKTTGPGTVKKRKRSVAQRFSSAIGVLLGINKFHRGVHVLPERHKLSGTGEQAEVATLYIGLGQAYFVNAKGDRAGIGTASPDGWIWTPADAIAPQVARALAVYENKAEAAFVTLPLRVR